MSSPRGPWPLSWTEFLGALGVDASAVSGPAPATVNGAAFDSRRVRSGDAFFALQGQEANGARFVIEATTRGAACVVAEAPTGVRAPLAPDTLPAEVMVGEARKALAQAAIALYRDPSARLTLIGLTGTNGKTTGAFLCRAILEAAGVSSGMVGTAGYWIGSERRDAPHTTPEAPDLCDLLDTMSERGLRAAVLEVSSHALELRRTYGLSFRSVVFTNLTRDHLDFHGSEDAYLKAKLRLFNGQNGGETRMTTAVVHASDPHAAEVLAACKEGGMRVVRFAIAGAPGADGAELVARDVALEPRACRFTIDEAGVLTPIRLPLPGRFNIENALAAWGATTSFGIDRAVAARALEAFAGVPGRLEVIDRNQPFTVLVDYAHTPDALTRVIATVRETLPAAGRLAVVFGCGGDRDRGKRVAMGEAAAAGADLAVVTDDNPRNENPAVIRGEVMKGAEAAFAAGHSPVGAQRPLEIAGRRRAMEQALGWARAGDVVLLAGKGHEGVQIVGAASVPFDDRLEAGRALEAMGFGS
ncbi:MAG: UDP-N-acetylmuramoyl-L-alanyl-D-glutamate--2,6-diaminopimelate ligase [Candidatus Eisenbacteria bacterium]